MAELDASPTNGQLEQWAIFIHECLSQDSRVFHSIHHVFEITSGCSPIQLLAACFRDCISFITDGVLSHRQEQYTKGVLNVEKCCLSTDIGDDDKDGQLVLMVMDIFGLTPGENVSRYKGLDVFMSAIVAVRVFGDTLRLAHLVELVTCMEATIPFRPPIKGETALERLYDRVLMLRDSTPELEESSEMTDGNLVEVIQSAADLSNRHLGNFATEDAATFLDHTWCLLPERSTALRRSYLYTVHDMLLATRDMERFMENLDLDNVFQSFRGVPDQAEMQTFHDRTERNLRMGRQYLRVKLLSLCVLSAFSDLTGGDAPMSFFCGDLPSTTHESYRLGQSFLLPAEDATPESCDRDVYEIMSSGRHAEQVFDTRNDPMAAYVYAQLGDEGVSKALRFCSFPMTKNKSRALLRHLPPDMVRLVGEDVGRIALSRTEMIAELLKEILDADHKTEGKTTT